MQLDLRTVTIKPLRQSYSHIAKRLGADKPATRYQEGTYDLQPTMNFHYRPIWAPEYEIFDARRTALVMQDWYKLLDPRQFYYGSYTLARARMQEAAEADFALVEDRNFAATMSDAARKQALALYIPLRHVEWGGNTNCMFMAAYGYGTAFTNPATFHAMDHLGMAQYLTRLGLTLGDEAALDVGKAAWMADADWQGMRKFVEDCFVLQDWFELFVAHSVALDGLMFPLFYGEIDTRIGANGGGAVVPMLTRFQAEWFAETSRWTNAVLKNAAAESPENKARIEEWLGHYAPLAQAALAPLAARAFGEDAKAVMGDISEQFSSRVAKLGLSVNLEG
jgi:phenol hydroxylase P1 protein